MKLLLDQGLPRAAATLLRDSGIDTIHVGEIGMAMASDAEIIWRGRDEGRTVVTLDSDFHVLLAIEGATTPSVIRIRIEGLRAEAVAELLKVVLAQTADDLELGAVVSVQEDRIRVRRLPLV
jgi:predicted nuclease of predicted toxin-antitoxin system